MARTQIQAIFFQTFYSEIMYQKPYYCRKNLLNGHVVGSNQSISYVFLNFIQKVYRTAMFSNANISSVLWMFWTVRAAPTRDVIGSLTVKKNRSWKHRLRFLHSNPDRLKQLKLASSNGFSFFSPKTISCIYVIKSQLKISGVRTFATS